MGLIANCHLDKSGTAVFQRSRIISARTFAARASVTACQAANRESNSALLPPAIDNRTRVSGARLTKRCGNSPIRFAPESEQLSQRAHHPRLLNATTIASDALSAFKNVLAPGANRAFNFRDTCRVPARDARTGNFRHPRGDRLVGGVG